MSKPFPDNPFLSGNFAPWPMEGDVHDLVVTGEIPDGLRGTYYRNGSNPQFAPDASYHWFNGDGMIHSLRFDDARVSYRNRWVRTERFEVERRYGESLFGGIGPGGGVDPRAEDVGHNASNTHVVWHAGRLLSLWEAGPPYELDPETLETIGIHDYDGAFLRERYGRMGPDIMTAHPKIDPRTGQWIAFGYSPLPPWLVYHEVDAAGRLTRSDVIEAPFPAMMHDFIVSAEHAIFPVFPAVFDFEAAAGGGPPMAWKPELGTRVGVLPRDGRPEDVVWIEHEPCFSFHSVNARTEGKRVIADLWIFPAMTLIPDDNVEQAPPTLHRWTIDLEAGSLKDEQLDDAPAEFGRVDPRYAGGRCRYVFSLGSLGIPDMMGEPEHFNCLFRYDLESDTRVAHRLEGGDCFGEPMYVPAGPDAEEGDGFVLALVYRKAENRSDMLVLDAQNLEREPLAVVHLPHRIPYGFHGDWKPA